MNKSRYYVIVKIDNQYVVDVLKRWYNIIEDSFYFNTKEEAVEKVKEEMLHDLNHTEEWCDKYNDKVLPDEQGNCSLCGYQLS